MPVITCTSCAGQLAIPDGGTARYYRCPHCSATISAAAALSPPPATIQAHCPHCRQLNACDRQHVGQLVSCYRCHQPFQVPPPPSPPVPSSPPPPSQRPAPSRPAPDPFNFEADEDDDEDDDRPRRRRRRRPQHDGPDGTGALILGLVAILVFTPIGPLAIYQARQVLRHNPDDGSAQAGLVLGWIATVLLVLACCFVGVIFAMMMAAAGAG